MVEEPLRPSQIGRGRNLAVLRVARDNPDAVAEPLHKSRIVGLDHIRPSGGCMGLPEDRRTEDLRGLRAPDAGARHRSDDTVGGVDLLQGIRCWCRHDASALLAGDVDGPRDDCAVNEWPGCIVYGDQLGVHCLKAQSDRILPLRAPRDQANGATPRPEAIEPFLGTGLLAWRNDHNHSRNLRCREQGTQRVDE